MTEIIHASPAELSVSTVLEIIEDGGRVLIEIETFGESTAVSLRKRDGTYYCDTRTKLVTHESAQAFCSRLETTNLVRSDDRSHTEQPVAHGG